MRSHVLAVLAGGPVGPTLQPNAAGLPGAPTLQRLADGIGGWALIASMLGIVIGAVLWASGRRTTPMKFLVSRMGRVIRLPTEDVEDLGRLYGGPGGLAGDREPRVSRPSPREG